MTWAHPSLLASLLLVPLVAGLALLAWRRYAASMRRLGAHEALARLIPGSARAARAWQLVLAPIALAALLLAAAGPRLGFDWEQRTMEGVSLVVILDVSRSMDAQDVAPSRIERARRELEDLAGLLKGDQVGLVLFAAGAWSRIPLTVDYATFVWAVRDSGSDTIRAQGSALSGALDVATKALARAPAAGRAVLVVSDGETHEDAAALQAAVARARDAQVRIYALGVGTTDGAPIPVPEGGFKKDDAGQVVVSRLDEATLRGLAEGTGGAYVRAVPSDDDVRALYETEIRGKLQASERGVRRDKVWRERFQWPLGLGVALLAAVAALGVGRRGAVAAVALALLLPGVAHAGAARDGLDALAAGRWDEAARLLGQARQEDPGDAEVQNGLATALYRAGRYREAEQIFDTLAQSAEDPGQRAVGLYNAGNAAYAGGRLDDALARFQQALETAPALDPARKNFDAVAKEIAARKQPPPPKPPEDGDGQQGEPQDGQQGEPQDGQQGEPQDGQQGEPQDGQQGEPQDGQQGQPPQPGDGTRTEGPEAPAEPTDGQPGDPTADGEPSGVEEGDAPEGTPADGMSAAEAARTVDAVQDGRPRVVVPGRSSGKDW